jgi:hypothetical protein
MIFFYPKILLETVEGYNQDFSLGARDVRTANGYHRGELRGK